MEYIIELLILGIYLKIIGIVWYIRHRAKKELQYIRENFFEGMNADTNEQFKRLDRQRKDIEAIRKKVGM